MRLLVFGVLLLAASYGLRRPLFYGNLVEVDPGRAFRSAQPGSNLDATIRSHQLKSILNLRGGNPSDGFYAHETEVAEQMGVEFHDLPMSATRRPSRRELIRILDVFEETSYPLLIHCKWGSDRTGLVSVLYRMMVIGDPPDQALEQFSLSYGHVPAFGPQHLHEPIDEYRTWLLEKKLPHTPARFRGWLEREYRSDRPGDIAALQAESDN